MMRLARPFLAPLAALALVGCFGGAKVPPVLLTLSPESAATPQLARTASAGEAVTIDVPVTAKELKSVRVPAQAGPTSIAYVKDLQWVDTPDRLFQQLLAETVTRTTGRVVIDPRQVSLDPGLHVSGVLQRFGYDASEGNVVVIYDGALSTAGGTRVETRRFEARAPADGTAGTVGPALNRAANQVAIEAAKWIGG
ncbi:MAG TPA: ABC-type transport auxiliary lipoprotein family protein [Sphingomicrobium sp.]|nr:ABC-type transport auxiliary lipoprotein family protein [Sphingomicrobium sp.]